jgi:hypothetical protein
VTVPGGGGVTPEDINSVRQAQEQMMPELAVVGKRVEVRDSRGGTVVTYLTAAAPLKARVGQVRDELRTAFAGQLRGRASAMLTVPVGSDLQEGDRVTLLGGTYNVVGDLSRASYATAARFLIEEV